MKRRTALLAPPAAALLAGASALGVAGCASTPGASAAPVVRGRVRLDPEARDADGRAGASAQAPVWPPPPEVPRYRWAGSLIGQPNFLDDSVRGPLARFGRWIAGLDSAAEAPLMLQRPSLVAGDGNGRVYVSDTSRAAVFVFDVAAGELRLIEQATAGRRFVAPAGVAPAGERVFVADADHAAVFVLGAHGEPRAVWGSGVLRRPTGVAWDAAGARLFVADTMAHDVKVFDAGGRLMATWGRRGSAPGEFNFPSHLAWARGELVVADTMNSRVQVFDGADGRPLRQIGERGLFLGNLVRPKGVAIDGAGNLYVVESYHDSVVVFSREGELLLVLGGTGADAGRFYLPAGLWIDGRDRVHVADMFNGRVALFDFLGGGGG